MKRISFILMLSILSSNAQIPRGFGEYFNFISGDAGTIVMKFLKKPDNIINAANVANQAFGTAAGPNSALWNALGKLSEDEASPDFGPSSAVMLPSICDPETILKTNNEEKCKCFFEASHALDIARRALARLQLKNLNTKNYVSSSLAFGDGMAGSVGVGAIAWMEERPKIIASYNHFKEICLSKYAELMGNVKDALMKLDQCEADLGEEEWYARFGFMYYEFLDTRFSFIDL